MSSKKEGVIPLSSEEEDKKEKPSLVEKIVDSIHQDIIDVLETIKETEKS